MLDHPTRRAVVLAYAGEARWPERIRPGDPCATPVPGRPGRYDISVISTDGARREHRGRLTGEGGPHVTSDVRPGSRTLRLTLHNLGEAPLAYRVACAEFALAKGVTPVSVGPGMERSLSWDLSRSYGWYDVVVTVDEDREYRCRLAGYVPRVPAAQSRPSGATTVDDFSQTQCGSGPSSGSM